MGTFLKEHLEFLFEIREPLIRRLSQRIQDLDLKASEKLFKTRNDIDPNYTDFPFLVTKFYNSIFAPQMIALKLTHNAITEFQDSANDQVTIIPSLDNILLRFLNSLSNVFSPFNLLASIVQHENCNILSSTENIIKSAVFDITQKSVALGEMVNIDSNVIQDELKLIALHLNISDNQEFAQKIFYFAKILTMNLILENSTTYFEKDFFAIYDNLDETNLDLTNKKMDEIINQHLNKIENSNISFIIELKKYLEKLKINSYYFVETVTKIKDKII